MSTCNYCSLRDIKRRAKETKERVIITAEDGGTAVYIVDSKTKEKRFAAWFMEVPNHCDC